MAASPQPEPIFSVEEVGMAQVEQGDNLISRFELGTSAQQRGHGAKRGVKTDMSVEARRLDQRNNTWNCAKFGRRARSAPDRNMLWPDA